MSIGYNNRFMSNQIKDIIYYFFHHRISGRTADKVYHRMLTTEGSKETEEVFSRIWRELDDATCPPEEVEQAWRRVEAGISAPKVRRWQWARMAAMWLVPLSLLCSTVYFYYQSVGKSAETAAVEPMTYYQRYAAVGTRECVTLPDRSVVWLNAGSILIYPSDFSSNRQVYLVGEGFFEVQKDVNRPFIVSTSCLSLKVLGTTFNVSAYPESSQMKATLETGCLNVKVLSSREEYILYPNDQLVYTPSTCTTQRLRVKASDYSEWRMGGLFFNDVPFDDVLEVLERTYGVKMYLQASAYKGQKIRVRFNRDETLDNVLRIVRQLVPGINYTVSGNVVYWR